jgi:exosortase
MIPLPYRVQMALGGPLQQVSTVASAYTLQTLGLPALAEGHLIVMDEVRLNVAEACNGLGMLYMFLAYAVGAVLVLQRPLLDKIVIVGSALPIAILANVTRIAATGLLHRAMGKQWADVVYHDLSGWLMAPLAFLALYLEILLLSHLFLEKAPPRSGGPVDSLRSPSLEPRAGNHHLHIAEKTRSSPY